MSQYSDITRSYDSITNLAFRKYCESWTFKKLIGDISGSHVLDVACGAGFVTDIVSGLSPSYICAVDIERKMIELAESKKYSSDNIDFICADIRNLDHYERYDLAVGAFSLNEMENKSELMDYLAAIFRCVKAGGTVLFEFDNAIKASTRDWSAMGYPVYKITSSQEDAVRYQIAIQSPEGLFELACTYHSESTLEEVFSEVGFVDIQFYDVEISREGFIQMGGDYWNELLHVPLTRFIKTWKLL